MFERMLPRGAAGLSLSRLNMAGAGKGKAEVVAALTYPMQEKDFKPYLSKIKELNPDVIFAAGYYNEAASIVRQAKELGIKSQILGEEGFDSPKFLEIAGASAEGVIIAK